MPKLKTTLPLLVLLMGCSAPSPDDAAAAAQAGSSAGGSAGTSSAGAPGAGSTAGGAAASGGTSGTGTGGSTGGSSSAGGSAGSAGTGSGASGDFGSTESMHLISRDIPVFASNGLNGNPYEGPELAQDDTGYTGWVSHTVPAWLAYDVSGVPEADRQHNLISWHANNNVYLSDPEPWMKMPVDYVIEANTAPGGTTPTDGWTELVNITDNKYGSVQLEVDLAGANWVRMRITTGSDPVGELKLDMDVYSIPEGASDGWLFMGDSITYMSFMYGFTNAPGDLNAQDPKRWPAFIDAAIGGTGAITAVDAIDETIQAYPGQFVALPYGTNDHPDGFAENMESLVQTVIAAGKVPVVPRMIWADSKLTEGPLENAAIDALYDKYPEILKGPDLWTVFENKTDLIPPGDVHPNEEGQKVLRAEWVKVMLSVP